MVFCKARFANLSIGVQSYKELSVCARNTPPYFLNVGKKYGGVGCLAVLCMILCTIGIFY